MQWRRSCSIQAATTTCVLGGPQPSVISHLRPQGQALEGRKNLSKAVHVLPVSFQSVGLVGPLRSGVVTVREATFILHKPVFPATSPVAARRGGTPRITGREADLRGQDGRSLMLKREGETPLWRLLCDVAQQVPAAAENPHTRSELGATLCHQTMLWHVQQVLEGRKTRPTLAVLGAQNPKDTARDTPFLHMRIPHWRRQQWN